MGYESEEKEKAKEKAKSWINDPESVEFKLYEARARGEDIIKLNLDQERQAYLAQLEAEQEEREPGTTGPEKMGLIFFLGGLFFCVIGDLIDFFTAGTIGWLIGLFIDFILLIMFGLSKAGRKQFKRMIIGLVGESFPIIATLPLRTIFLIWAFINSRSKIAREVTSVAQKAV